MQYVTVNTAAGALGNCSSSDELSDSESDPVAKNLLILIYFQSVNKIFTRFNNIYEKLNYPVHVHAVPYS